MKPKKSKIKPTTKKSDTFLWIIGLGVAIFISIKAKAQPEQTQVIDVIINE